MIKKQTIRRCCRHVLDIIAWRMGKLEQLEKKACNSLTILMYHRVLPDELCEDYLLDSLVVSESSFKKQVAWLAEYCTVKKLNDALLDLTEHKEKQRPLVVITFDDGYWDNYKIVAPILEQYGLFGTFFICTNFVEKSQLLWFDRAVVHWKRSSEECRRLLVKVDYSFEIKGEFTLNFWMGSLKKISTFLRSNLLRELDSIQELEEDAGLFKPMEIQHVKDLKIRGHEIGSHTSSHALLPQLNADELIDELAKSKSVLEQWTGGVINGLCYPNGDYSDNVERVSKVSGYKYACTTQPGLNSKNMADTPYSLFRQHVHPARVTNMVGDFSLIAFRSEIFNLHSLYRKKKQ